MTRDFPKSRTDYLFLHLFSFSIPACSSQPVSRQHSTFGVRPRLLRRCLSSLLLELFFELTFVTGFDVVDFLDRETVAERRAFPVAILTAAAQLMVPEPVDVDCRVEVLSR